MQLAGISQGIKKRTKLQRGAGKEKPPKKQQGFFLQDLSAKPTLFCT
jgi:hypothetical protein